MTHFSFNISEFFHTNFFHTHFYKHTIFAFKHLQFFKISDIFQTILHIWIFFNKCHLTIVPTLHSIFNQQLSKQLKYAILSLHTAILNNFCHWHSEIRRHLFPLTFEERHFWNFQHPSLRKGTILIFHVLYFFVGCHSAYFLRRHIKLFDVQQLSHEFYSLVINHLGNLPFDILTLNQILQTTPSIINNNYYLSFLTSNI